VSGNGQQTPLLFAANHRPHSGHPELHGFELVFRDHMRYTGIAQERTVMARTTELYSLRKKIVNPAILVASVAFINGGVLSAAPIPALTFNEAGGGFGSNLNQNVGWRFDVLSPTYVTGLGWFDQNHDGLGTSHEVGIWDANGTLLTSAIVPSGTAARLDIQYRVSDINPLLLSVGTGYVVGGLNTEQSGDRLAANVSFTIDSRLAFSHATFSTFTSTLLEPTNNSVAVSGFFGPMFEIDSVPEPSTLVLVGFSGIVLVVMRRISSKP
jgi:hypothetical protein